MFEVIFGNICSMGATLCDSFSGTRKTKKDILLAQCVSQFFYIASSLALKGYSATVQNAVSVFRNIYAAKDKNNKIIEWLLIISPVVLGLYFNNRGLLGLLPVLANLEYSLAVFIFAKNPTKLKYAFVINAVMFCIFNFSILNFVGGVSCLVIIVTTAVSVIREKKAQKTKK